MFGGRAGSGPSGRAWARKTFSEQSSSHRGTKDRETGARRRCRGQPALACAAQRPARPGGAFPGPQPLDESHLIAELVGVALVHGLRGEQEGVLGGHGGAGDRPPAGFGTIEAFGRLVLPEKVGNATIGGVKWGAAGRRAGTPHSEGAALANRDRLPLPLGLVRADSDRCQNRGPAHAYSRQPAMVRAQGRRAAACC